MAIQDRMNKLKGQVDDLRKNYAKAVTDANKVVTKGLDTLADKEIKAIKKTYEDALRDLKKATDKGNVRDIAQAQAKVLKSTMDRVVKSARDSATLISKTSKDVAKIMQSANSVAAKKATAAKKPAAKKPAARKKPAAKKPAAKKPAAKKAAPRKKAAAKKPATAKAAGGGARGSTRTRRTAAKK